MKIFRRHRQSSRALLLVPTLVVLLAGIPQPSAAQAIFPEVEARTSSAADWTGRYCPPSGCASSKSNPMSHATGFLLAVLAMAWLAGLRKPERG